MPIGIISFCLALHHQIHLRPVQATVIRTMIVVVKGLNRMILRRKRLKWKVRTRKKGLKTKLM